MKSEKLFTHVATEGAITEYLYKKNGLRVIHIHLPHTNTVISNVVYLVGSRHESRGQTGIAHMLEHMLFKQTRDKNGKKVTIPRHIALQNKGASLNASTWSDRTNYYYVMPPQYLGDMLMSEAERMRGLVLAPHEFLPEQQNVLSEYEMYSENPDFILQSAIAAQAFISHGYGHETIGYKADIQNLTVTELKKFYDTYYWPNNACLVIAGDVRSSQVLEAVHEHFAHIPQSPQPIPSVSIVEPTEVGVKTITITRQNPITLTSFSFRAPSLRDAEWVYAYIFLTYLGDGKLSPLYKKLVDTHKVSSISVSLLPSFDENRMSLTFTIAQGVVPSLVQDIVLSECKKLRTENIKEEELTRIKNKLTADFLYSRDGAEAVASEITEYIAGGDWKKYVTILQDIENVSVQGLRSFIEKWLKEDCFVLGTFKGT